MGQKMWITPRHGSHHEDTYSIANITWDRIEHTTMLLVMDAMVELESQSRRIHMDSTTRQKCLNAISEIREHPSYAVFEDELLRKTVGPAVGAIIHFKGFEAMQAKLSSQAYATLGDLVQEIYGFFGELEEYGLPESVRSMLDTCREQFENALQREFPSLGPSFCALHNFIAEQKQRTAARKSRANEVKVDSDGVSTSEQPEDDSASSPKPPKDKDTSILRVNRSNRTEEPMQTSSSSAVIREDTAVQKGYNARRKRKSRSDQSEVAPRALARWAALSEVVWYDSITMMSTRAWKQFCMLSETPPITEQMIDNAAKKHKEMAKLESIQRIYELSVQPALEVASQSNAGAASGSEEKDKSGNSKKASSRLQVFLILFDNLVEEYEAMKAKLLHVIAAYSLVQLDSKVQRSKSAISSLRALPEPATPHAVDECISNYMQLAEIFVLNQLSKLTLVPEPISWIFKTLQQLYKEAREFFAQNSPSPHRFRPLRETYRSACEILMIVYIDNRYQRLLSELTLRNILEHVSNNLRRRLDQARQGNDATNEWMICEQLTFADIGLGFLAID